MCQKCKDLVNEYFPNHSMSEQLGILWGFTSFPFSDPMTPDGEFILRDTLDRAKNQQENHNG